MAIIALTNVLPKSKGIVKLASADPKQHPIIDPRYFSHPRDMEVMVAACKLCRNIAASPPLCDMLGPEVLDPSIEHPPDSDEYIREDLRNIAIIAHVDHGKTSLVDAMLQSAQAISGSIDKDDRLMDSNDQERERGITILAKNASVDWKGVKINIIDTPGHADFGGEVERILNMADACLLLVDAQEGPMPQTKFVLKQALKLGRKVIVCINKVDKPAARCDWVLDTTFDLFADLGADDELCDFPVSYASGFLGVASLDGPDSLEKDLSPILDQILEECPKPRVDTQAPLQMLVSNLDFDPFIGRISIGRLRSGSLKVGQELGFKFGPEGDLRKAKVSKLWDFHNNGRREVDEVKAGDICAFCGMDDVSIGDTVVDPENPQALPPIIVEEPTVVMEFGVNSSPFSGQLKETKWVTSSHIKNRLEKETMTNLAMRVEPGSNAESFKVKARGILQLGILIENLRREGFEVMIGPPEVITTTDPETGEKLEPYEDVVIDTPTEYQGTILDEFNKKSAELLGWSKLETRGKPLVEGFIFSDYKQEVANVLHRALRGHETANFEFPLMTKDKLQIDILLNPTTRRDAAAVDRSTITVAQQTRQRLSWD